MSDELIALAEAALEGVTPGPWAPHRDPIHFDTLSDVRGGAKRDVPGISSQVMISVGGFAGWKEQEVNTRFIAASRQLVPDLLAALRAERAARERAEAMVAAAYQDAAEWIESVPQSLPNRQEYAVIIRTRTPADAQAALDRIRQQAADEALELAAALIEWTPSRQEPLSGQWFAYIKQHETAAAIRAMKGGAK